MHAIERLFFRHSFSGFALLSLLLVAILLGGCRKSEQNRPLHYEKGVYGGEVDEDLDLATRNEIRLRHRRQNFGL